MCGDGGDGGGGGGDDTGVDATGGQGTGAVGGSTGDTGAVGGSLAESESEAAISAAVSTGPSLGAAMAAIDPTVSVTPANQAMSLVSQTETAEAAAAAANAAATSEGLSSFVTVPGKKGVLSDIPEDIASKESQAKSGLFSTAQSKSTTQDETTQNTLDSLAGQVSLTETTAEQQSQIDQSVGGRTSVLGRHFARASKGKAKGVALGPIQEENTQSLMNMVNFGLITNQEAMDIAKGDISEGGLGSMSPAVGWGVNSETGLATMEDLAALNVTTTDPTRGYEVTEPQPTDAGVAASYTLGQLNPTAAAGLMAIGSMVPGPAGFVGSLASAMNPNPGLLSAIANEIGFETPSFLDPVTGLLDDITDTVTDVAGQALTGAFGFANEALDATLGQAFSAASEGLDSIGFGSTEEAGTGFDADTAGGVDGGAPDIQPAPPTVTPPRDVRPAATAVAAVDTFLDTSVTTPLVSIPDIATPTLGVDEDLGVAPMMTTLPRRSSFRRSRVTSARDRAFGAANLFRPTLSAGISL